MNLLRRWPLLVCGLLAIGGALVVGNADTEERTTTPVAASTCDAPAGADVAETTSESGDTFCIVRTGSAPNVRIDVHANGERVASYTHDACSWPNAGRSNFVATAGHHGATIVWGSLPPKARSVRGRLANGKVFSAKAFAHSTVDSFFAGRVDSPPVMKDFRADVAPAPGQPVNACTELRR